MALRMIRILLLLSFSLSVPLHMFSKELDADMQEHVELHAEETAQVELLHLRSLEQRNQEESVSAWKDLLLASCQYWQFWAVAGVLVPVFGLFWRLRKRSHRPESGCKDKTCSSTEDEEEADEGEDSDAKGRLVGTFAKRFHGAKKSMAYQCQVAEQLVSDLLGAFQARLANSFFAVLEPAIGVGSAFEGWNPRGRDAVYRLLVPLKPPRGHTFHLELGSAKIISAKNRVRVQLECTCTRHQGVEDMLCFVHQPEEALRRNQDSSLLSDLCTGYYLDVQKIARWFRTLVSSAWGEVPQWHRYSMKVLPTRRSCKLQLTNASGRSFYVEVIFGVQQGDSDIFVSSQAPEHPGCFTPGTSWEESYAFSRESIPSGTSLCAEL